MVHQENEKGFVETMKKFHDRHLLILIGIYLPYRFLQLLYMLFQQNGIKPFYRKGLTFKWIRTLFQDARFIEAFGQVCSSFRWCCFNFYFVYCTGDFRYCFILSSIMRSGFKQALSWYMPFQVLFYRLV